VKQVTDYKFCTAILRRACNGAGCLFVDVPVCFDDESGFVGLRNGQIWIGSPKKLGETFANIIFVYLKNFREITGKEVFGSPSQSDSSSLLIANFIRKLTNRTDDSLNLSFDEPIVQRLYQYRFVWLLMQDLVCPAYAIPVNNHRIICYDAPKFDIADCFEEIQGEERSLTVFVNAGIEYEPCLFAGLFLASIECHKLDPAKIVQELLESGLRQHFIGLAKLAFQKDEEVDDFIAFLLTFTRLDNKVELIIDKKADILSGDIFSLYKESQHQRNFSDSSWWYFGLLEKMLESVRGADWTTYKTLTPYLREMWDKIHEARRKKGRDGLNYEALLRIKNKEMDKDEHPQILEVLLGNNRVW